MSESAFTRIAKDLLNIEVNTIIKDGMTARKMPPFPVAVLEIATSYYWFLFGLNQTLMEPEATSSLLLLGTETRTNHYGTFKDLREASEILMNRVRARKQSDVGEKIKGPNGEAEDEVFGILYRIYRNCGSVEAIIHRALEAKPSDAEFWNLTRPGLHEKEAEARTVELDPQDAVAIRKIWEVGTEVVAIQSVVGLDGDVVTRLGRGYTTDEMKDLRELHLLTTRLSIDTWERMANLVGSFLSGALRSVARFIGVG